MITNNCEQGTEEWLFARMGIPTSSMFSKIVTSTGDLSKSSVTYMDKLLAEYIEGESDDYYESDDMKNGTETESKARIYYESVTGDEVEQVGLVYYDINKTIACSPDGIISDKKGIEIKCPKLKTQIKRVREGKVPTEYLAQIQGSMWVTGATEWVFLSYHPKYKPFMTTVKRDKEYIAKLGAAVLEFSKELEKLKLESSSWNQTTELM